MARRTAGNKENELKKKMKSKYFVRILGTNVEFNYVCFFKRFICHFFCFLYCWALRWTSRVRSLRRVLHSWRSLVCCCKRAWTLYFARIVLPNDAKQTHGTMVVNLQRTEQTYWGRGGGDAKSHRALRLFLLNGELFALNNLKNNSYLHKRAAIVATQCILSVWSFGIV